MKYQRSLLLFQDNAATGVALKIILYGVVVAALIGAAALWSSGEKTGGMAMVLEAIILAGIFSFVILRKYQVYEDHLRVVMGGPFTYKIGFDSITSVEVTRKTGFSMNMASTFALKYVLIKRRGGMDVAITPRSNELFAEAANRALDDWRRQQGGRPLGVVRR